MTIQGWAELTPRTTHVSQRRSLAVNQLLQEALAGICLSFFMVDIYLPDDSSMAKPDIVTVWECLNLHAEANHYFPTRWHSGKESTCQCRRHRFDPWVGKIPWRRNWQYSCLKNPKDRGTWWATVQGHKESDTMERWSHSRATTGCYFSTVAKLRREACSQISHL